LIDDDDDTDDDADDADDDDDDDAAEVGLAEYKADPRDGYREEVV
jgi:hypothetical protein